MFCFLFDRYELRLYNDKYINGRKYINLWKLNNVVQNKNWVEIENKKKIKIFQN